MNNNGFKGFDIVATFINAIALVIAFFSVYIPWSEHELTYSMKIGCVISIVLLLVGTMLEVVGSINNRNVFKANKYLAINIWFYSLFFGMICIFLDLPYMWAYISHILVAIIICSIALFRNNNCKKQIEK